MTYWDSQFNTEVIRISISLNLIINHLKDPKGSSIMPELIYLKPRLNQSSQAGSRRVIYSLTDRRMTGYVSDPFHSPLATS